VRHSIPLRASNSAPAAPQNQLHLANASQKKSARWAAMCHASKEMASALIAGVIVVVADWKNSAFRGSAKSIAVCLQDALAEKVVGCEVVRGVGT